MLFKMKHAFFQAQRNKNANFNYKIEYGCVSTLSSRDDKDVQEWALS